MFKHDQLYFTVDDAIRDIKNAVNSPMHTVVILRGVPGSGKSTVAKKIKEVFTDHEVVICSADDYFLTSAGEYIFDPSRLPEVHHSCLEKFKRAIAQDGHKRIVIVDNTNSTFREYSKYNSGLPTFIIELFCKKDDLPKYAARNLHQVPLEVIERMFTRWEQEPLSIKIAV